jgi:glucose/mannose transport system permease protein
MKHEPVAETAKTAIKPDLRQPRGRKPMRLSAGRVGLYVFLVISAAFFLLPLYVMIVTSFKTMGEIRLGSIFALPFDPTFEPWLQAWSSACTGLACEGVKTGFWNSIQITIPSVVLSIFIGALVGYNLSFWRPKGGNVFFALLLLGAFIPYQVFIYPLVRMFSYMQLFGTLPGIVIIHVIFGLPIMTLLFRNYFSSIPREIFNAARIDGGGFFRIFFMVMLPMSLPIIVVAAIIQVTNIWNDFLLGLIFAGRENLPMTVLLNNIVNTTTGERFYNVDMAATILTSLVPILVYFFSGRLFVRGIAAGSLKG